MKSEQVQELFRYHPPTGRGQVALYEEVRNRHRLLAEFLVSYIPEGPERTLALRALHLCSMHANSAIALTGATMPEAARLPEIDAP